MPSLILQSFDRFGKFFSLDPSSGSMSKFASSAEAPSPCGFAHHTKGRRFAVYVEDDSVYFQRGRQRWAVGESGVVASWGRAKGYGNCRPAKGSTS